MHCMLSYECFLYHQPVIQWVRTWKMQLMYDNLIDISFWTALLKACTLVYFTQRRRRRLRKRHLKSEFALPQTLSRLFYLVEFVKCWQIVVELNSKGLHQSSGKEKESCCLLFPSSTKREIRQFHVVVVQRRQRNVQKSVMHLQSCCFAYLNLFFFCRSRCRRRCVNSLLFHRR